MTGLQNGPEADEPEADDDPLFAPKPTPAAERMAKLLRMMTSSNDFEVLIATRKFFAECARNGIDMMKLAGRLAEPTMAERIDGLFSDARSTGRRKVRPYAPEHARNAADHIEAYSTGLGARDEALLARVRARTLYTVDEDAEDLAELYDRTMQNFEHRKRKQVDVAKSKAARSFETHYRNRLERVRKGR